MVPDGCHGSSNTKSGGKAIYVEIQGYTAILDHRRGNRTRGDGGEEGVDVGKSQHGYVKQHHFYMLHTCLQMWLPQMFLSTGRNANEQLVICSCSAHDRHHLCWSTARQPRRNCPCPSPHCICMPLHHRWRRLYGSRGQKDAPDQR